MVKEIYTWTKAIVFALIITFICREFIFSPVLVQGESMQPTFENNDKIIVAKSSKIERFDMIVFHAKNLQENHIKRVIGLPGDRVEMKDDRLYINGKEYKEDYLQMNKESIPMTEHLTGDFNLHDWADNAKVPDDSLFVLGDNRRNSTDGREYGFIKKDSVIGEVKIRFYPLKEIGIPK